MGAFNFSAAGFFSTTVNQVNTLTGLKKLDSELNNRLKIADQGEFDRPCGNSSPAITVFFVINRNILKSKLKFVEPLDKDWREN